MFKGASLDVATLSGISLICVICKEADQLLHLLIHPFFFLQSTIGLVQLTERFFYLFIPKKKKQS